MTIEKKTATVEMTIEIKTATVEMTIEKKTATVEMTMVVTDKRGYNKAKKKGGAIENRPAP